MTIRFERRPGPALCFHVLAHLPLGRDAASLHDPGLLVRPWVPDLLEAYRTAPGRLHLQTSVLVHRTVDDVRTALSHPAPWGRDDAADRTLASAMLAALEDQAAYLERFEPLPPLSRTALEELACRLAPLRRALWETDGEPPDLTVVDVPALGHRGRATRHAGGHLVGTSLAEPPGQVLCALLHEETHPRTDGAVLAGTPAGSRDTRAGSDGFALHQRLEEVVIDVDRALLQARAPDLLPDYAAWLQRIGSA